MTITNEIIMQTDRYMRQNTAQRYGQAIFNVAFKLYPTETNELRSTDVDPFYDDSKVGPFLTRLAGLVNDGQ